MMSTLSATTESMIRSFLGPCKGNKVVIEDNNFHIVRCPHHLLKETVIQDPFNFVVEDTLEMHHENYGCSTTTLLAMWHFWRAELVQLLHEGYQLPDIVTHSQDILETVVFHLYQIELDLKTLIFPSTAVDTKLSNKSAARVGRALSYSSRHYSPAAAASNVDGDDLKDVLANHDTRSRVQSIVEKLSHDDEENSGLVSDLWMRQMLSTNEIKFCSESMILCPLTLPSSHSSIVEGCILKSKLLSWCDQEKILQSKALIIKGSLVHDYVHLGGSSCADATVRKKPDEVTVTKKDVWLQKCFSLLEKLQINALLVHGAVDEDVACYSLSHSICLLSHIPWSILEMICLATNTSPPCVYLTDCDEKNVIHGLELKVWKPANDFTSMDDKFVQIHVAATKSVKFYTVVLCHPNPSYLECLEHQLKHLVSRLSLVVKSGKLLPGSGKTEEWCCNLIKRFAVGNGVKAKIGSAIANGFFKYYDSVKKKLELKGDLSKEAYDDIESKVQAWRSALCIVIMALQCDTILINDPNNITLKSSSLMGCL